MSRLYLIFLGISAHISLFSQNELGNFLDFADEQYAKGDYYYALQYYDKALHLDSNSVAIYWKYAETLKAYKDYLNAEIYYKKVYKKEESLIYTSSLLNIGLMEKYNGKYDAALETFKRCKKKYLKDKKSYLYLKSCKEIESCLWAKSALKDTLNLILDRLPENVNTKDSEFGHTIHDGKLIFSSLRGDSIVSDEEVYAVDYKTNLYVAKKKDSSYENSRKIENILFDKMNTGNGTFSLDGKRFYYSLCKDDSYNYKCKIMVANYKEGKWGDADSLGEIINMPETNTTMPCIGEIDQQEVLFFASDRSGTEGGLDIWYSFIKNGNQYSKVKTIKSINSIENELTPWWDNSKKRLYFSSSWHNGYGGNDIFYSNYNVQFETPVNAGIPINSSANDIYYFKDTDTSYFSSNRIGVLFSKNPTCCSDIFKASPPKIVIPPTPKETLSELNKRLPVTLYFHNDVPDPRSVDTTSKVNYINSYTAYKEMLEQYKKEYSTGLSGDRAEEAKEDIESFFVEYVDQGVKDLTQFRELLLEELQKGSKIKITIKGFASPLAKTDYNVKLTKRRIASLINYLKEFDNGIFTPYINGTAENGGQVQFAEVPFGEYTSNKLTSDNPNDQKNSIYSRSAGIERKIEIQSVNYMDTMSQISKVEERIITLSSPKQLMDAGKIKPGDVVEKEYTITNTNKTAIDLEPLDKKAIPCDCNTAKIEKMHLEPGESTKVNVTFNSNGYEGQVVKSIYLKVKNQDGELRLIITTEVLK
jgi:tetratricopeptide (TPR) repeat protein